MDVSSDTSPAVWSLQYTALFLFPRSTHSSLPQFVFIAVTVSQKKKKNLHPFSNVENVVQMFLIVIIKAKSGYVTPPALTVVYYFG